MSTPIKDNHNYYTPEEAAQVWRVDPQTVRFWLREGRIEGEKLGGGSWRIPADVVFPKRGKVNVA